MSVCSDGGTSEDQMRRPLGRDCACAVWRGIWWLVVYARCACGRVCRVLVYNVCGSIGRCVLVTYDAWFSVKAKGPPENTRTEATRRRGVGD